MRSAIALLAAAALCACATGVRDPHRDPRFDGFRDRIERDRDAIEARVRAVDEPDPARRAERLARLDAALSSLFAAESQGFDALAYGDASAFRDAEKLLDGVESVIGLAPGR